MSAMARRSGFGLFAKKNLAILDCIVYSLLRGWLVSSKALFQNTRGGLAHIVQVEPVSSLLQSFSACVVGACMSRMVRLVPADCCERRSYELVVIVHGIVAIRSLRRGD